MRCSKLLTLASVSALALFGAQRALAQAPSGGSTEGEVSEVIVTALKKSESVQSVPASISALTGNSIQQRGLQDVEGLQFAVPSLQSGTVLGATQITIRGIGPGPGGPSTAVYVDGVYQPIAALANLTQVDLARVEVLRGPQGTLYGRNANGGAVNFISNAPTSEFGGYLQGGVETYSEYRLQGMVNLPVSDRVRSRLVLDYDERDKGYIRNVVPGQKDLDKGRVLSGRLRVGVDLAENLALDVNLEGLHSHGPFQYFTLRNFPNATGVALNPYLASAIVPLEPRRTSANGHSQENKDYYLASATLTWKSPIGDFKAITANQQYLNDEYTDQDATQLSAFDNHNKNFDETFTEELNLSSKVGPVDAILGAFYMDELSKSRTYYQFPLGINPLPRNSYLQYELPHHRTRSEAAYLDLTWNVSDQFRLIGGGRYSRDKQDIRIDNQIGLLLGGVPTPVIVHATGCPGAETNFTFSSWTGKGGLQYDLSSSKNVYGTVSTGYLDGGLNAPTCPLQNVYKPEKITAYESGFKGRFLDNHLTFNASVFYYDFTNLQVSQTVNLSVLIQNAASAHVKGLEMEAEWVPDTHWSFDANLSVLDAKYVNFFSTDSLAPALGAQDVSGNYLSNAPKRSGHIGVAYTTSAYDWGQLVARVDATARSRVYFREFNLPLDGQAAYGVVNLNLIWNDPSKRYSVRAYAENVGNTGYIVTLGTSNNFGSRYVAWGRPRQLGVEAKARF